MWYSFFNVSVLIFADQLMLHFRYWSAGLDFGEMSCFGSDLI